MRALRRDDLTWVVEELRDLPKQSLLFADVPDDVEYVFWQLSNMFDAGVLKGVVSEDTGSFLLYVLNRPWYADRLEIHEMILWVPERYRGGRTAYGLIRSFTEYALDALPHSIHAGHTLDITAKEKTLALYRKCGYTDHAGGVIMRL